MRRRVINTFAKDIFLTSVAIVGDVAETWDSRLVDGAGS